MKKQAFVNSFSFFSLDGHDVSRSVELPEEVETQQADIRSYVLQQDERTPFNQSELFRTRLSRLAALDFYRPWLHERHPACFRWLNKAQRQVLEEELFFAFYILCAQYQLDEAEARQYQLADLKVDILLCVDLINQLRASPFQSEPTVPEKGLALLPRDRARSINGLSAKTLASPLIEPIKAPSFETPSRDYSYFRWIRQQMCWVNEKRLYWVWGGSFLHSIVDLLPETFHHRESAEWVLNQISPITGSMSFALYYARGFLELLLLLKHTVNWGDWTPWMNPDERDMTVSWWERFQTQWALRKYNLLNDFIWASCNMACYYWLVDDRIALGKMSYGYLGNLFTAVLLFMDASLALLRYQEKHAAHDVKMAQYQRSRELLAQQIQSETNHEQKQLLEQKLLFLNKMMQHDALEWTYGKKQLQQDLIYARLLLFAFAFLCCFFVTPVGPGLQIILNVAGSALCWGLNVWNDAMLQQIQIEQACAIIALAQQEQQTLLSQMNGDGLTDSEQRVLYSEYQTLQARCVEQEALIKHNTACLIYTTTIELIVPPLLFGVLVFLPFSQALGVLIAVVMMANYLHVSCTQELDPPNRAKFTWKEADFLHFKTMAVATQSPALLVDETSPEETSDHYAWVSP